jgi:peptidyl-prolyl cis-trans isomerase SurA
MEQHAIPRFMTVPPSAALLAACALALTGITSSLAAEKKAPRQAAANQEKPQAERSGGAAKHEQAIVVLVNDEPITAYEIQQRANFLALSANVRDKVQESFKRLVQAESTNKRVRAILENVIQTNPGKTRDQVAAIFEERKKQFALQLQKQALNEARAGMTPQFRKAAQEELIEEKLKMQEAKRLGLDVPDSEHDRVVRGIAERNKMTDVQFAQHMKSEGVDISTMKDRFRVQFAWREVVRRRFASQVSISQRDVEREISASAAESGEDAVELQVQKITLQMPERPDQNLMAKRYAEADALRGKFIGCKTMASLTGGIGGARHEDLKYIKPSSIPEPTRSLLLSAKDGDLLPPTTAATGIEVYAVCGRRPIGADDKVREKAEGELAQKEFEIVAKRHLRDLMQDAHIEYR